MNHLGRKGTRLLSVEQLARLCSDRNPEQRRLALAIMQSQIGGGTPPITYLPLARGLIEDPDNTCRWQALITIAGLIPTHPEEVWAIIGQYGNSDDADLRAATATVLLEDLLEEHFDEYFPRVREKLLQEGSSRFADTVAMCWFDRCEGPRYRLVQKLLRNVARGGYKRE